MTGIHRVARLQLRGMDGPLPARVCWPARPPLGLLVLFGGPAERLCAEAGLVVLAASCRPGRDSSDPAALVDATTAVEWAADHAAALDADPAGLLVGGEGAGATLAAAVALFARDERWPPIGRQVLIDPPLGAGSPLLAAPVEGIAPATVVGARGYAARLRAAGVEVDETSREGVGDALRRALEGAARP